MPFFQNASDIHIESSDFKDVAGDYIHNDNSWVTTNTNSNNRTINRTIGSYNTSTHIDRSCHETNNTNHGVINEQHNKGYKLYRNAEEHSDEEYDDEPLSSLHPQPYYQNIHSNPQPYIQKHAPQALPQSYHGLAPAPVIGTRRNSTRQLTAQGADMNAEHLLRSQQLPAYGFQHGHSDVRSHLNLTMPSSPFDVPPHQQSSPLSQYGFDAPQQFLPPSSGYSNTPYNLPYQGGPHAQSSELYHYGADSRQQSYHHTAQQPYHHSGSYLQQPQPRPHLAHTTSEPLSVASTYKSNNPFKHFIASGASSPPASHTAPISFDAQYFDNDKTMPVGDAMHK